SERDRSYSGSSVCFANSSSSRSSSSDNHKPPRQLTQKQTTHLR
ncbi:35181_t:CDS:1, partial [Racocetra persica]